MKIRIVSKMGVLAVGALWFSACGGSAETSANGVGIPLACPAIACFAPPPPLCLGMCTNNLQR